jgi:hypothetical protein
LLQQDYLPAENIRQERFIISAAWKELGKGPVHATSILDSPATFVRNKCSDAHVVRVLHRVLSDADIIVAHNGDAYDIKFTEARMLYHGLPPLPPILKIDTLKVARDRFLFNANNLDYLGKFLKVGQKKHTKTGLWLKVLDGDKAAIREMVRYNKQDVLLLERVFNKLRPYIAAFPNRELFGQTAGCPRCGSLKVHARGIHRALTQLYQRFQCQACGGWFREKKASNLKVHTRTL